MFTFTCWFHKLFFQKQPFTNDLQSSCSEKFSKIDRKALVMEFSFDEAGDCNFKIKEFNQRFFPVNFDISFYEILPVFWKQLLLFLLHFGSFPAEAIMIWLILNKWTPFSYQSFRGVLVKLFDQKKLVVSHENVSGGALF